HVGRARHEGARGAGELGSDSCPGRAQARPGTQLFFTGASPILRWVPGLVSLRSTRPGQEAGPKNEHTGGGPSGGLFPMTRPVLSSGKRYVYGGFQALSLDTRTQNAPSRIAPTKAKTANTARTSSFKARSTSGLPRC